jgi:hypothetical protein
MGLNLCEKYEIRMMHDFASAYSAALNALGKQDAAAEYDI